MSLSWQATGSSAGLPGVGTSQPWALGFEIWVWASGFRVRNFVVSRSYVVVISGSWLLFFRRTGAPSNTAKEMTNPVT